MSNGAKNKNKPAFPNEGSRNAASREAYPIALHDYGNKVFSAVRVNVPL